MDRSKGPQDISAVLSELFSLRGWGRVRGEAELADIWHRVAEEDWYHRTRVLGCRRGVLQIAVDSAPLRSELETFHRRSLLSALQQAAPHWKVRDIKFLLQRSG